MKNLKLPTELLLDKDGIFYIDLDHCTLVRNPNFVKTMTKLKKTKFGDKEENSSTFYDFCSTNDYCVKVLDKLDDDAVKTTRSLTMRLIKMQKDLDFVELPIGYAIKDNHFVGQIIRKYPYITLLKFCKITEELNLSAQDRLKILKSYIKYSDDEIENLFCLYKDIITLVMKAFANNLNYQDVTADNFVLCEDKVALIDFDCRFLNVSYSITEKEQCEILAVRNMLSLMKQVAEELNLPLYEREFCPYESSEYSFDYILDYIDEYKKQIKRG